MKILEDIHLIAGGIYGIGLSSRLDCNVFVVDGGQELALIDAGVGADTERIVRNLEREQLDAGKVKKLFLTHAHLDHSGGAADLKKRLNLEIYLSAVEAPFLEAGDEEAIGLLKAKAAGVYPQEYSLRPATVDHPLRGEETVRVGKYSLRCIATPGHSRGSMCFLVEGHQRRILFVGDTVFQGGYVALLNLPDSSLLDYAQGIDRISTLAVDSLLPSHYGFTVSEGQHHIDLAKSALAGLSLPKML